MSKSSAPDKNVDKMGYMSVMVGDSAALFHAHLQEYGRHYGTAAHHVGQAFQGKDGVAVALLQTAHRVMASLESLVVPWITVGSTWHLAAATMTALATWQQARCTRQGALALQHQVGLRYAEQLLQSTTPHAIAALIQTAHLYAHDEGGITDIHVVVSDSYQAAQVRIQLLLQVRQQQNQGESMESENIFNNNHVAFRVFESLQEAFDAASSPQPTATATTTYCRKVLIYVATLQPLYYGNHQPSDNKDTVLRIHNCHDFVLRADAGHDTGPRLVLKKGTLSLENSHGKFHGVALGAGFLMPQASSSNPKDTHNHSRPIQFVRCTTISTTDIMSSTPGDPVSMAAAAATTPTTPVKNGSGRKSGLLWAGSLMVATAVSTWFYCKTHGKDGTAKREARTGTAMM